MTLGGQNFMRLGQLELNIELSIQERFAIQFQFYTSF